MKKSLYIIIAIIGILLLPKIAAAGIIVRPVINTGLVGYWDFNEGAGTVAYDKGPYRNNGTFSSTMTQSDWVNGKIGKALDFDGSDDSIVINDTPEISVTGAMTISFWAKFGSLVSQAIIGKYDSTGNQRSYLLEMQGTWCGVRTLAFTISSALTPFTGGVLCSSVGINDSDWHHIVARFIPSTLMEIYIDGKNRTGSFGTGSAATAIADSARNLAIGRSYSNSATPNIAPFNGTIDEVRIYSRALSEAEIYRLYKLSAPRINSSQRNLITNGLIGYWSFDGADINGNEVINRGAGGNNGTITGATRINGKVGQALSFDGSGDYVQINDPGADSFLDFDIGDEITFSFWTKLKSMANSDTWLMKGGNWGIQIVENVPAFYFYNTSVGWIGYGAGYLTKQLSLNKWYHIALTYKFGDATSIKVYVNNELWAGPWGNGDGDEQPLIDANPLLIGDSGSAEYIDGIMDEVRLYNRALEPSEITVLYSAGSSKFGVSQKNQVSNGLVGYWSFNGPDISGTDAFDRSGSGNHGVISGATKTIGKVGQGLDFGGADDYIAISDSAPLIDLPNGTFSFSAWVKVNNDGTTTYLFSKSQSSATSGWEFSLDQFRRASLYVQRQTTDFGMVSAANSMPVYSDGWLHIAVVFAGLADASNSHIYVNGSEVHDYTARATGEGSYVSDSGLQARIGMNGFAVDATALIDEVRIYNRVLEPEEIQRLYNLGR